MQHKDYREKHNNSTPELYSLSIMSRNVYGAWTRSPTC